MNVKPLSDYLVVKTVTEEVTKSGIVLPDTVSKERPQQGEVIAAGEGKILESGQRAPMGVKVGDKVMFRGYPQEVKIEGEEYLIIKESDVVAIIN
ncbi:co-chaperone GroES [Candidatus Falkowbacteria bacterium]|nr:co-chaperone GroES [Candidatus Falkowbacteria bacterium]